MSVGKKVIGFMILVAAGVSALSLLTPARVEGLPPNEVERFHFATNGNEIGHFFRGCDGSRIREGNTSLNTPAFISYTESCPGPGSAGCWSCSVYNIETGTRQTVSCSTGEYNFDPICTFYAGQACGQLNECQSW